MNLIFLDIDGVLNSMAYFDSLKKEEKIGHYAINNYNLKILAQIYHENQAKIILSSTWRECIGKHKNEETIKIYKYLVDCLKEYNMYIYDHTPLINNNRPLEIFTYLYNMKEKDIHYISIDDDFSQDKYDNYFLGKCLIRTNYFTNNLNDGGLQPKHILEAKQKMKLNVWTNLN